MGTDEVSGKAFERSKAAIELSLAMRHIVDLWRERGVPGAMTLGDAIAAGYLTEDEVAWAFEAADYEMEELSAEARREPGSLQTEADVFREQVAAWRAAGMADDRIAYLFELTSEELAQIEAGDDALWNARLTPEFRERRIARLKAALTAGNRRSLARLGFDVATVEDYLDGLERDDESDHD